MSFKTVQNQTLTPTDFADDPDLQVSYANVFINCVFSGAFEGINFTRATFYANCVFEDATVEGCNFTDINPNLTSGASPVEVATECNFTPELPEIDYSTGVPGIEITRVPLPVQQVEQGVEPGGPPDPGTP